MRLNGKFNEILQAMGAATFTYPREVGLPFGGKNYNPHIRLEMHYNNPNLVAGVIDSSGMRIKFIDKLRKFDAAVMELGLEYTDKMAIPPGELAFPLSGYCIAECTKIALPNDGITVFGSQLHTHLRGVRGKIFIKKLLINYYENDFLVNSYDTTL
jgi:dopamine beta-monooxygenase